MSNVLKVGNVEIVAVLDASAAAPPSVMFPKVVEAAWEAHRQHLAADGAIPLSMTSFVVRAGGKTLLIDTGMGVKDRPYFPNGRLPDALAEMGVRPDSIDVVLATHIHIDHVGGHTVAKDGGFAPAFAKATHIFTRAEWDYWTAPAVANAAGNEYVVDSVLPLQGAVDIDLVENEHRVSDEIVMVPTPGHTPAHTSFLISSAGESALILGDVAHNPAQVTETSWSPAFDLDPALSAVTREKTMDRIEKDGLLLAAGHFPHPGFGRVVRIDNKRHWRAL